MPTRLAVAPAQTISAEQAADLVRSDMWIDYGAGLCQPDVFDKALAARKDALHNVKIRSCLSMHPRAVVEADPDGRHFCLFSWHFSGYDRKKHDAGRCHYMPVNLGEIPDYYRRFLEPSAIAVLKTCPINENGLFNFGITNTWLRAVIERTKIVVVEVSCGLPDACGQQHTVHVNEVDYIIEGDHLAAPELANPPPCEIDRAVAPPHHRLAASRERERR